MSCCTFGCCTEFIAADDNRYRRREARQELRFFQSGVAAADDNDFLFTEEGAVAYGAEAFAVTDGFLFARDIEMNVLPHPWRQ